MSATAEFDCDALVIGSGPAGLMAADVLSAGGAQVLLVDAMPSFGRKFLMAGKSGLNLTKDEELGKFLASYADADWLVPILARFGPAEVKTWALDLGQEIFTGSSGRVFPKTMKASPLLRAWLARLAGQTVVARSRWRWIGWQDGAFAFDTPDGRQILRPRACVLALGGGSWARLGSDGGWTGTLAACGVEITALRPANMGFDVGWSPHVAKFAGQPVKPVALAFGGTKIRGEMMLTTHGVEGGAVYALSARLAGAEVPVLTVDLMPDLSAESIAGKLAKPRGKASLSNFLRKTLGLTGVKLALLHELSTAREPAAIAESLKALPLNLLRPRPMDEAISTAGGIAGRALDADLMLHALPGVFCAGEMLDWSAPTGGYLINACLATGRQAGMGALVWLRSGRN